MKLYHISYFDNEDSGASITLFGDSKEEATNVFFEIGDMLQGGIGGGLNYVDEIATLEPDEEETVRAYYAGSEKEKCLTAEAYVAILEKYGEDPDEDDLYRLRQGAAMKKKAQYDIAYNKKHTKQCNFRLSRISNQREIEIYESLPDKSAFLVWALNEWKNRKA